MTTIQKLLARLRRDPTTRLRAACSPGVLERLPQTILDELDIKLPREVSDFYRVANGMSHNDFSLCYTADFASSSPECRDADAITELVNLNHSYRTRRMPEGWLVFGYGDFGLIVFHARQKQWLLADEHCFDVLGEYGSLEELVNDMLDTIYSDDDDDDGDEA